MNPGSSPILVHISTVLTYISATQEDELAKLYEILETQRDEIGRLNDMLDGLGTQGGVSLGMLLQFCA